MEEIVEYKVPQLGIFLGLATKGLNPRMVRITVDKFQSDCTGSACGTIKGTGNNDQVCQLSTKHRRETIKSISLISPDKSTVWVTDIFNNEMVQIRRVRGDDVALGISVYIAGTR